MRRPVPGRDGYALLSVLWVVVGVSALGLVGNLAARDAVAAARNRADLTAAAWAAEDCLERARAAIAEALAERLLEGADGEAWTRLDERLGAAPLLRFSGCTVTAEPAGARLDLNAASDETVRRLLMRLGVPGSRADSLVDALADWRDADDAPRPAGIERAGYAALGRRGPRNGPLAHVDELASVRGWDEVPGLAALVDVEPGRVALGHAPLAVIEAIPGLGPEAAARLGEMRLRGAAVPEPIELIGSLSPSARDEAMRRFPEIVGAVAREPEAWILRARASVGEPPVTSVVELRVVRGAGRAAVVRRRTWTE
jgi:general secretion pathway protein K